MAIKTPAKKLLLPFITTAVLIVGLAAATYSVQQNIKYKSRAFTPLINLGCSYLNLNPGRGPNQNIYNPGENITISTSGNESASNIRVWWMPATRNLTQANPWLWQAVSGSYNSTTKVWSGSWTAPQTNGEYLVSVNVIQPDGKVCAGNPGYQSSGCPGCQSGTFAWGGLTPGTYPCYGCRKTIVVNSNFGNTTGFDMKRYWNMSPGYYWDFTGQNSFSGSAVSFKTRIAIEEKTNICGYPLLPVRYTKDKPEGYIYPLGQADSSSAARNLRFFLSYFESNQRWSATTMGSVMTKHYDFDPDSVVPLGNLGKIRPTDVGFTFAKNGDFPFENIFYSPYFYSETYMASGYKFDVVDKLYGIASGDHLCDLTYQPAAIPRHFQEKLFTGTVTTPAYSGPVLILRQIEGREPWGAGWLTREDWYLARDIGIVQIDKQNLRGQSCVGSPLHPDCNLDQPMANPPIRLQLTDFYTGGGLVIQVQPTSVPHNGSYTLRAAINGRPYTGWLEAKTCISESECDQGAPFKWTEWVENGVAVADLSKLNIRAGLRHSYFRPWIEKTPAGESGETLITITQLPWSNEVHIRHL